MKTVQTVPHMAEITNKVLSWPQNWWDGLDLKIDGGTFSELSTKGGIIVHHVFLGSGSKEFPYEQGSTKNELKENTSRVEAL